jgi:uncharacterized membrane protein
LQFGLPELGAEGSFAMINRTTVTARWGVSPGSAPRLWTMRALAAAAAGAAAATAAAAAPPSDAEILALISKHCTQCHAAEPTHEAFAKPPKGIVLQTVEQISRNAPKILDQVVIQRAMPLGNETGMTDAERDLIAAWIEGRK